MTPLAWILILVALVLGTVLGRMSGRGAKRVEDPEDPRVAFEHDRADKAEEKVAAQEDELRGWAASHKVLEAQVSDLQAEVKAAAADSAAAEKLEVAESSVATLEAKVSQLEGTIASIGASKSDMVATAQLQERVAVLGAELDLSKRKVAELERRLNQ